MNTIASAIGIDFTPEDHANANLMIRERLEAELAKPRSKESTIRELVESGDLPDDVAQLAGWFDSFVNAQRAKLEAELPKLIEQVEIEAAERAKLHMLDMVLPNRTRFGEAYLCDLLPYADNTMDEIAELLAEPDDDDDEADFLEDGSTPAPNNGTDGVEFVTEEELAERDKDIVK